MKPEQRARCVWFERQDECAGAQPRQHPNRCRGVATQRYARVLVLLDHSDPLTLCRRTEHLGQAVPDTRRTLDSFSFSVCSWYWPGMPLSVPRVTA